MNSSPTAGSVSPDAGYALEALPAPLAPAHEEKLSDAAWAAQRTSINARLDPFVGEVPPPVDVVVERGESSTFDDGVAMTRVRYPSPVDGHVSALLLHPPCGIATGRAALALHQTSPEAKDEVAGLRGDSQLAVGRELARRGYVVLAPDILAAGDRLLQGSTPYVTDRFYETHGGRMTMIGAAIADHRQSISVLTSLVEVSPDHIAAIGHSLGGYNAFFLAAYDERVRAVVNSCGLSTFSGDPTPGRWGVRRGEFTHFDRLTPWLDAGRIPFEFHEVLALVAPRPLFTWSTTRDRIFPHWQNIVAATGQVADLYTSLGRGADCVAMFGHFAHAFPQPVRNAAYEWLDRHLSPAPAARTSHRR